MTQRQLADSAGLSVGLVRDLEQGRTHSPRWGSVEALASALELDDQARAQVAAAWERDTARERPGRSPASARRIAGSVALGILGPLVAERSGRSINLGPVRRRAVLALLCLPGSDGVRMGEIIELLWPSRAPASALSVVQGHISQLRQLLTSSGEPPKSGGPIIWTGAAYRLRSGPPIHMDADDFSVLACRANEVATCGEPDRACDLYDRALELWRGVAVADIACLQEHPLVVALNRRRAEVTLRFADSAALAGDHGRALPRLQEACQREPLSEILHASLMAMLGKVGRRAEAVGVFEHLRDRLDRDLGISPSDALWHAYGLAVHA